MEMAEYDVPAQVNYVLNATGAERLSWVGHSQGTAQMFAHLSDYPEFADKLNVFIALAPIASVVHQTSWLLSAVSYSGLAQTLQFIHVYDFLPYSHIVSGLLYDFCSLLDDLCIEALQLVADANPKVDNTEMMPFFLGHEPGGTSIRDMEFWQ
jgi:pimeloyl-ACP methyl ester carboxylesterase